MCSLLLLYMMLIIQLDGCLRMLAQKMIDLDSDSTEHAPVLVNCELHVRSLSLWCVLQEILHHAYACVTRSKGTLLVGSWAWSINNHMVLFNAIDPSLLSSLLGQSPLPLHILHCCVAAPPATERENYFQMGAGMALSGVVSDCAAFSIRAAAFTSVCIYGAAICGVGARAHGNGE